MTTSALIMIEDLSIRKGFSNLLNSIRSNKEKWLKLKSEPTYIELDFWDFVEFD